MPVREQNTFPDLQAPISQPLTAILSSRLISRSCPCVDIRRTLGGGADIRVPTTSLESSFNFHVGQFDDFRKHFGGSHLREDTGRPSRTAPQVAGWPGQYLHTMVQTSNGFSSNARTQREQFCRSAVLTAVVARRSRDASGTSPGGDCEPTRKRPPRMRRRTA